MFLAGTKPGAGVLSRIELETICSMPCVSDFYGIAIYMYYSDHAPPHFHAEYNGDEVEIEINTLGILNGGLKRRALGLVLEWATQHQAELLTNWNLARRGVPLQPIEGLQ